MKKLMLFCWNASVYHRTAVKREPRPRLYTMALARRRENATRKRKNKRCVKFSRDGDLLAVATHIGVWVYDAHVGAEMVLLNDKPKNVRTIAFSPDGKTLATGSWSREGAIQLWDIDTATQVSTMGKGIGSVGVLAFSEDGRTLASVGWRQSNSIPCLGCRHRT